MSAAVVLDRDTELARLVRAQARDDRQQRVEPRLYEVNETDLGDDEHGQVLNLIEDFRTPDPAVVVEQGEPQPGRRRPRLTWFHLIGLDLPWTPEATTYDPAVAARCPACGDAPDIGSHCVICGRGPDSTRAWPMRERQAAKPRTRKPLKGGLKGRK